MATFTLRHWLDRAVLPTRGVKRRSPAAWRRRSRLLLETLESRWVPATVTNLDDAGAGSLRQAILDTPAGGTVDFQPGLSGTIALISGQLTLDKDLSIAGPGADVLTVSGNNASRVFNVTANTTMTISGLTIANGRVNGVDGGGIYNAGTLTITASTLSGNVVSDNRGGGIYNAGTLTVTASTFSGNANIVGQGGGIANAGTATITTSIFSGNAAGLDGGGIMNGGAMTVTGCTFSGNSGARMAGGILNDTTATVINSTFSDNSAGSLGGGGIALSLGGTLTVISSTLSGNHSSTSGGGIYVYAGTLVVRNTLVAGNTAASGSDLFMRSGPLNSQGHNLIGNGTGASGYHPTDLVGTPQNPIDPLLGPLQDNGGPTQTMALMPGSPAIDAGDNTDAPEWDQRGPGFPRILGGTIDIGAFETLAAPTVNSSVAQPLLWPPFRQFVNVGLGVEVNPPDANVHLVVYGNDQADPSDVRNIAPEALRLRAERRLFGTGRVYLVVAEATNVAGTAFDVSWVIVPRFATPDDIAAVMLQAMGAETWYRLFQIAPPGFRLLGESGGQGLTGPPAAFLHDSHPALGTVAGIDVSALASLVGSPVHPPTTVLAKAIETARLRSSLVSVPVDDFFAYTQEGNAEFVPAQLTHEAVDEVEPWAPHVFGLKGMLLE